MNVLAYHLYHITQNKTGIEIGGPSPDGTLIYQNATKLDNVIFSKNTVWSNHDEIYIYIIMENRAML